MREITPSSLESLPSRLEYTKDFVNFTKDDAAALHAAKPVLAPLVPAVVDAVYVKLSEYSITWQAFLPRQTGFEGNTPTSLGELSLDHPQIKFRKDFLSGYIVKLVSMDYDSIKSWEYLDKVAIMHTGVAGFKHREKKPGLRVEYVHMGLLLGKSSLDLSRQAQISREAGYVQDIIVSAVIGHSDLDINTKLAVVKAVNKILWLQNDLFARHYIKENPQPEPAT